jgi:hypothetical protein
MLSIGGRPRVDPHVELEKLRKPASVDDLHRQRGRLQTHLDVMEERSFEFEHVALELAHTIAAHLSTMVDESGSLSAEQRATLRAAIEYFVISADAEHDLASPIGLEDDAIVANAAFEMLGRPDLVVQIPGSS